MDIYPTFCELYFKITPWEIIKAISKLKSGNAVGIDILPNEILESGGTNLIPILQKLFNLVFALEIYLVNGLLHIYVLYFQHIFMSCM